LSTLSKPCEERAFFGWFVYRDAVYVFPVNGAAR